MLEMTGLRRQRQTQSYPPLSIFFTELPCVRVFTRVRRDGIRPSDILFFPLSQLEKMD